MERSAITDRIVAALAARGPRSTADLAREFLGLGILDEALAERLLGPTLRADPRLAHTPAGWIARDASPPPGTALDAPFVAVVAPRRGPISGTARRGEGPPRLTICLGGEAEAIRHETRTGEALPRPVIDLAAAVRRLRSYRGAAAPVPIAEALGLSHVEPGPLHDQAAADAEAAILAETWTVLAAELALEGVADIVAFERQLAARLEPADFGGKRFGPEDLALGSKELMRTEQAWRTLKSGLRIRPVHHWAPHRIEAPIAITVLPLLLERVAERACDDTWRNIPDDLKRIKLAQLSGPHGRIWQVTEPGAGARQRLQALGIENPPAVLDHA